MSLDTAALAIALKARKIAQALASKASPIAISPPLITGYAAEGKLLTALRGDYSSPPTSFTQRWLKDGVAIAGQTGLTCPVATGEAARSFTFEETPTNAIGTGGANLSAPVIATFAPAIAFANPTVSVPEGNASQSVTITLNVTRNGATGPLIANLSWGGTATPGVDYAAPPATMTIPNGQNSASITLAIMGDRIIEPDETILIGAMLADYPFATASKSITIVDDDMVSGPIPDVFFTQTTQNVAEGNSGTSTINNVISVDRKGVDGDLRILLSYGGTAIAGVDYVAGPSSITIFNSENIQSFNLTINGDTLVEPDETIIITATLEAYSSASAVRTLTILNDDGGTTAPINTSPPVLIGNPQVGQTAMFDFGIWTGSPAFVPSITRNGAPVAIAADATSYMFSSSDLGATIVLSVAATENGLTGTASSELFGPILAAGNGNPELFTLAAGSRIYVMGNSIDTGYTPHAFVEETGEQFWIQGAAAAASQVVDSTPDEYDYADFQLSRLLAQPYAPDAVYIGGTENDASKNYHPSLVINGLRKVIDQTKARWPNTKFIFRNKIPGWGESDNTRKTRAAQILSTVQSWQGADVFLMDAGKTFAPLPGDGRDGENGTGHPGYVGAVKYGKILAGTLLPKMTGVTPLLPATGNLPSSQNVFVNWDQAGTAGIKVAATGSAVTPTGDVSDGWSVTNTTGLAVTCSKGSYGAGVAAQVIEIEGANTLGGYIQFQATPTLTTPIKAGERWEWIVEYETFHKDGVSDPIGLYGLSLNDNTVADARVVGGKYRAPSTELFPSSNAPGRKKTMRSTSSLIAADIPNPIVNLKFWVDARAVNVRIKVGRVFLRRVPQALENKKITLESVTAGIEGTAGAPVNNVVIVARRQFGVGAATVNYAVTGSGANPVNGADFEGGVLPSGTLAFADGALVASVSLPIAADSIVEADEQLTVTLSNPTAPYTLVNSTANAVIIDDDGASYPAEAMAMFARMTTPPSQTLKDTISTLITTLKAGPKSGTNIWTDRLTEMFFGATDTLQQSKVAFKDSANDAYDENGTIGHVPHQGWQANGTAVLRSAYYPTGLGGGFGISVYSLTSEVGASASIGTNISVTSRVPDTDTTNAGKIGGRSFSSITYYGTTFNDGKGLSTCQRTGSTGGNFLRNGASAGGWSRSSGGAAGLMAVRGSGAGFTSMASIAHLPLSAVEHEDLYDALHAAGLAMGAAV